MKDSDTLPPLPSSPAVVPCELDHLVVAASNLEQGVQYLEARLGCKVSPGGRHPRMGTHNALLSLGPGAYVEVLAIDPDAPPPQQARWFGLDGPEVAPLLAAGPRLLTWVVSCAEPEHAVAASPWPHGRIETMSRGDLFWRITIPKDGALVEHGVVPAIMHWPPGIHPTLTLPDVGLRLERLELFHPEPGLMRAGLGTLGLADKVECVQDARRHLRARLTLQGRSLVLE